MGTAAGVGGNLSLRSRRRVNAAHRFCAWWAVGHERRVEVSRFGVLPRHRQPPLLPSYACFCLQWTTSRSYVHMYTCTPVAGTNLGAILLLHEKVHVLYTDVDVAICCPCASRAPCVLTWLLSHGYFLCPVTMHLVCSITPSTSC